MNNELFKECVDYFRKNEGFKRVFKKIDEKYRSLGTLGGRIQLNNLSECEKDALTGFFGKNYYKKSVSIKVGDFVKKLDSTKFSGVDFKTVLEELLGHKLCSRKDEELEYKKSRHLFYEGILNEVQETHGKQWLLAVFESDSSAFRFINKKYYENREALKRNLKAVCRALSVMSFDSRHLIRLALLASEVTKDPHFFDQDRDAGKLMIFAIVFFIKTAYPKNAEELAETMYNAGIIKDEVSNYTLCSGMLAYFKENQVHQGWKGFYDSGEPIQVSLINISRVSKISSPHKKVYVFENPTVFSEILYRTLKIKPSLICSFGNFKLASLVLMDKLVENGAHIYYSGDMDPEGIVMADKLKFRYGQKLILWRYGVGDYQDIVSKVVLTETRIKKLQSVKSAELMKICEAIENCKCAAYQELLIDKYEEDIRNNQEN
ncbi:TIGR02679 domain-containing protein [Clostridium sp. JNZ X4-2]